MRFCGILLVQKINESSQIIFKNLFAITEIGTDPIYNLDKITTVFDLEATKTLVILLI